MGAIFSPISDVFGWLMGFFYNTIAGMMAEPAQISYFAITMMLMAVVSKLITIPLMAQSMKSSKKMQDLQPKLEEIKKKYSYDQRIQQEKIQEFYKENGASAMGCSSCLPTIIQLVLIVAMLQVLREPAKYLAGLPGGFDSIAKNFFWVPNLVNADPLTWLGLPLANGITQLIIQLISPARKQQEQMGGMGTTLLLMPVVFYFMSLNWAAGLLLYWAFGNLLEILYRGIGLLIQRNRKPVVEGGRG